MAIRIEEETQENSRLRMLSTRFSKAYERQQTVAERLRILDLFSTYNFEISCKQTRKIGNTKLFAQTSEYQSWKASPESSALVYTGMLGSGKSGMLANIIDNLTSNDEDVNSTVAYFFCRHEEFESRNERTIVGALARQIVQTITNLASLNIADRTRLDSDTILFLLRRLSLSTPRVYIVVDGLHLCDRPTKELVFAALREIQRALKASICISYRLDPNIEINIPELRNSLVLSQPDNESDIRVYIESELPRRLLGGILALGDPVLILAIRDALLKGSQGMFLWVSLQIHMLCSMNTDVEITEALSNLPRDLSQVYERILAPLETPYRKKVFQILLAAKRSLTVHEMREALSFIPDDPTWDPSKLLNDVKSTLETSCSCLIVVDEEEQIVRTIHPSFDAFLLATDFGTYCQITKPESAIEAAQSLIFSITWTYLSYEVFKNEWSTRMPALDVSNAPAKIIQSLSSGAGGIPQMTIKLLISRKNHAVDISPSISKRLTEQYEFHFYHYAIAYALQHMSESSTSSLNTLEGVFRLVQKDEIIATTAKEVFSLMRLALQPGGDTQLVEHLLQRDWFHGFNPFSVSGLTRETVQKWLADSPFYPHQIFRLAIECTDQAVLQYLLVHYRSGIDEYARSLDYHHAYHFSWDMHCFVLGPDPLYHAVKTGRNDGLRLLVLSGLVTLGKTGCLPGIVSHVMKDGNWEALEILLSFNDDTDRENFRQELRDMLARVKAEGIFMDFTKNRIVFLLHQCLSPNPLDPIQFTYY